MAIQYRIRIEDILRHLLLPYSSYRLVSKVQRNHRIIQVQVIN